MSSKVKARQERRPKRFIPDQAPDKGARRAQKSHQGREGKREANRRDWRDYEKR